MKTYQELAAEAAKRYGDRMGLLVAETDARDFLNSDIGKQLIEQIAREAWTSSVNTPPRFDDWLAKFMESK